MTSFDPRYGHDGPELPRREPSPQELLRVMANDLRDIVRLELQLARNEMAEGVAKARQAAVLGGVAAGSTLLGALMIPFAMAWALALVVPIWASFLIVAGVFLLIGGVFALMARSRAKQVDLRPERTIQTLQSMREDTWT